MTSVDGDDFMKNWFHGCKLKLWGKLEIFEIDRSAVDLDLRFILWFWIDMSSSVVLSTVDLELILRFQVDMSRKIIDLDPGEFYDFKLKCRGKLKVFDLDPWKVDFDP